MNYFRGDGQGSSRMEDEMRRRRRQDFPPVYPTPLPSNQEPIIDEPIFGPPQGPSSGPMPNIPPLWNKRNPPGWLKKRPQPMPRRRLPWDEGGTIWDFIQRG